VLVHSETHGMELIRYVHNNPVRAGLVERASESGWSSHRAYLGLEACPPWLSTEAVFGPDEQERESVRHELACFVDEGRSEGRRPELSGEVSLLTKLRRTGLRREEEQLLDDVLGSLIDDDGDAETGDRANADPKNAQPKVLVLKRQRT
jgi:hypothetical protein